MDNMKMVPKKREFTNVIIPVPWGHVVGRWYGNRQERPILALHGWMDNIGTWETLVPLLPRHVGILCIDMPGHGQSSHLPKGIIYHLFDYVHIIQRVMREFGWQKVSLMGHSMGSVLSFFYTSLLPHTVDLVIAIEAVKQARRPLDLQCFHMTLNFERPLVEEERKERGQALAYTYPKMEQMLFEGTLQSVALENCKYILNRGVVKTAEDPQKYYFTRDPKVKTIRELNATHELELLMGGRIHNVPYCVVKGSDSDFINEDSRDLIELLRQQNPDFEMHEVSGTHHVHLNNSAGVAAVLTPFIRRHRPPVEKGTRSEPRCKL